MSGRERAIENFLPRIFKSDRALADADADAEAGVGVEAAQNCIF